MIYNGNHQTENQFFVKEIIIFYFLKKHKRPPYKFFNISYTNPMSRNKLLFYSMVRYFSGICYYSKSITKSVLLFINIETFFLNDKLKIIILRTAKQIFY